MTISCLSKLSVKWPAGRHDPRLPRRNSRIAPDDGAPSHVSTIVLMMIYRALFFAVLLVQVMHAETLSRLAARGYAVIPEPQQVDLTESDVRFGPEWSLSGDSTDTLREE